MRKKRGGGGKPKGTVGCPKGPKGALGHAGQPRCKNPHCGKLFTPGHYGKKQLVCSGSYLAECKRCKGRDCRKCGGKGSYKETCQGWYRKFWAQTRKRPRGIPDDDFAKISKEFGRDVFWRSYAVVARQSGLRKGEQLGVTWADILDGEDIRTSFVIRGQWKDGEGFQPTKTDTGKIGYLLDDSCAVLKELLRTVDKKGEWRSCRLWEVTESAVWSRFTGVQRRLGIMNPDTGEPYRVHDLRHTAALRAYKATGDITRAQVLLGHKNTGTTMIYTQERPEDFVASLEAAFKGKNGNAAKPKTEKPKKKR